MTIKRIHREIADLKKEDLGSITLVPSSDNLFIWKASIPGPEGSCYEGGVFSVDVQLPADYPCVVPRPTGSEPFFDLTKINPADSLRPKLTFPHEYTT
jgi:ubiquitin-protein ligase